MIGTQLHDMTSGFELFTREALQMVLQRGIFSRGHFFQTEIKIHCRNLKIVEVPILYTAASPRLGMGSLKDSIRQLWRIYRLRRQGLLEESCER
jgi:dolichol-phosphate mannosyltransferase